MKKIILNEGDTFSRLTVLSSITENGKYHCVCDCGELRWVQAYNLKSGTTKSCGCLKAQMAGDRTRTHGMTATREHNSWASMIQRCTNENHPDYERYGGRGIDICTSWRESFEAFYADMGERPEGMTLERVLVNEGYHPENCIWADESTQNYHQRIRKDNTSGVVGVRYDKEKKVWQSRLWKGGEVVYSSDHKDFDEAVVARKAAELEHYGYEKSL